MSKLNEKIIDIMKRQILYGRVNAHELASIIMDLGKAIDRNKVYGKPYDDLTILYNNAIWLKSIQTA